MPALPLACTVRDCGLPLDRRERQFTCAKGHAFDVAHSGYINLLQPQDRRSRAAGDSRAAVEARAALLAAGAGRALVDDVAARMAALDLPAGAVIVDLGCGGGHALDAVVSGRPLTGIGIDLSTAAVDRAARFFASCTWVVANADRRLPLLDHQVHLALSLHGRRNPDECARVLAAEGFLLIAVPAPDDLIELRALTQGRGAERDRSEPLLAEHDERFRVCDRWSVREQRRLPRASLLQLLQGTYRGARSGTADRLGMVDDLEVTLAADLLLLAPR